MLPIYKYHICPAHKKYITGSPIAQTLPRKQTNQPKWPDFEATVSVQITVLELPLNESSNLRRRRLVDSHLWHDSLWTTKIHLTKIDMSIYIYIYPGVPTTIQRMGDDITTIDNQMLVIWKSCFNNFSIMSWRNCRRPRLGEHHQWTFHERLKHPVKPLLHLDQVTGRSTWNSWWMGLSGDGGGGTVGHETNNQMIF